MAIPDMPDGSVLFVSFRGNLNSQRIISTFHYRPTATFTAGTPYTDYLTAFYGQINGAGNLIESFLDVLGSDYTLEEVRIQPVFPTRLRYASFGAPASGTWVPDLSSQQNIAASVNRKGILAGRQGIGRVQVPLVDGQASGGFLVDVNGYVTKLNIFATEMLSNVITVTPTATWVPCLGAGATASLGLNDLMSASAESTVRTMHRRTTFLGE